MWVHLLFSSVGADLPPEGIGYPQDGCNTTEHSIASPNDSLASGDITEDSVRVHIRSVFIRWLIL